MPRFFIHKRSLPQVSAGTPTGVSDATEHESPPVDDSMEASSVCDLTLTPSELNVQVNARIYFTGPFFLKKTLILASKA